MGRDWERTGEAWQRRAEGKDRTSLHIKVGQAGRRAEVTAGDLGRQRSQGGRARLEGGRREELG